MRDQFIASLLELAKQDERIILLTGDLGFKVFDSFREELPEQFLNVGVAEQNMTGVAVGLALEGRVVFTYSIGNFVSLRCLEQIRNDICYHDLNVNVVSIGAGFSYGALGISHHATEDLAIMRSLPEMTVVSPGTLYEVSEATKALVANDGPGYLRLDKSKASIPGEDSLQSFVLGRNRVVKEGRDFTLVCTGGILADVMAAADELAEEGILCRVLNVHTLKPFDAESVVAAAQETGGIVTVEEHSLNGGLGGLVAETLMDRGISPKEFYRIGLRSGFSSIVGSQAYLRTVYNLDKASIVEKIKEFSRPKQQREIKINQSVRVGI